MKNIFTHRKLGSGQKYRLLLLIFILSIGFQSTLFAQISSLVSFQNGQLEYTPFPMKGQTDSVNVIPDFSYAGYMGGGVPIPNVPTVISLSPEAGNDTERIQDAIDSVEALTPDVNGFRGAVLLTTGSYDVDSLFIQASGVVLRGEGQGLNGTVLNAVFPEEHDLIRVFGGGINTGIALDTTTRQSITSSYVAVGSYSFEIANTSAFSVGDTIAVRRTPNGAWINDLEMDNETMCPNYPQDCRGWDTDVDGNYRGGELFEINHERIITAISGNTITVNVPIVDVMEAQYGGGEVYKASIAGRISNCGVENLRVVSYYNPSETKYYPNTGVVPIDEDHLWTAVVLKRVVNSWVKNVTAENMAFGAVVIDDESNFNTVQDCASIDHVSEIRGGRRYSFRVVDGLGNFFQRNYTREGRHDYELGSRVTGPNVFLDNFSTNTHNDIGPHQKWSTGTLFDNIRGGQIRIRNRKDAGSGHGWAGNTNMLWNSVSYRLQIVVGGSVGGQNWAIGCTSVKEQGEGFRESTNVPVQPRSLYLQQLDDRLGQQAVANITTQEQRSGTIFEILEAWAGEGNPQLIASQDVITAFEDANVKSGIYADSLYGDNEGLAIKYYSGSGDNGRQGFVKFKLDSVAGDADYAKLRMKVSNDAPGSSHYLQKVADDTWSESTLTWNNQPTAGDTVYFTGVALVGNWVEFDITEYLNEEINNGDSLISFFIREKQNEGLVSYESSETANPPEIVYYAGANGYPPVADFTYGANDLLVSFDAGNSYDSDGILTAYSWDFGDGNTGTGDTLSHTFSTPGEYAVTLTVTDNDGDTRAIERIFTVIDGAVPVSSFSYTISFLDVEFDGSSSSDSDGSIASYHWDFGDGTTSTSASDTVSHRYPEAGTYTAKLTVTDNSGNTNASEQIFYADPGELPVASFEVTSSLLVLDLDGNASSDADGTIASYSWDFGDGIATTGATVSHTYDSAGIYTITLLVTDDYGNEGETQQQVFLLGAENTLTTIDDAYVRGGTNQNNNYGGEAKLLAKESGNDSQDRRGYLKFDLSAISGLVSSAKVRLKVKTEDVGALHNFSYVSNDGWSEDSVTWFDQPGLDHLITSVATPALDQWVVIDVTNEVNSELNGDDVLSIGITDSTGNTNVVYHSKEASSNADRPQLVFDVGVSVQDTLSFSDDSYVQGGTNDSTNFGGVKKLIVKSNVSENNIREAFLKADLSGIPGSISSAKVRIKVQATASSVTHAMHFVSSDSWTESGIIYVNKPSTGALLDSAVVPAVDEWIEFDITDQAKSELSGDGVLSVSIVESSYNNNISYHSNEASVSTDAPQLALTYLVTTYEPIVPVPPIESFDPNKHSDLWGVDGELWDSTGILLDYSEVGYMQGNDSIPNWSSGVNVLNYGAVGDGVNDDTQAFRDAIAACPDSTAVYVPNGTYKITDSIYVSNQDYFVLRGEDMYNTILTFPQNMAEIHPWTGLEEDNPYKEATGAAFFDVSGGTHRSIENFTFEFKEEQKGDHFDGTGANAIKYRDGVMNSWIKNIYIKNANDGIIVNGVNLTVMNIVLDQYEGRPSVSEVKVGHHGVVLLGASYSLVHDVLMTGAWHHDMGTGGSAHHNVFSRIESMADAQIDHHSAFAHHNMWTEINVGEGTRIWEQNQSVDSTIYWNIKANQNLSMNAVDTTKQNVIVGMKTNESEALGSGYWYEVIDPDVLQPANIYFAQLEKAAKPLPGPALVRPVFIEDPNLIIADEDSYVANRSDTLNNFGSTNPLLLKHGNFVDKRPLFKFDLTENTNSSVAQAVLRVYCDEYTASSSTPVTVMAITDDSWTENGITYLNQPAVGTSVDTVSVAAGADSVWYEWDITTLVNSELAGNKLVSLYLDDLSLSDQPMKWRSREGAIYTPRIILTPGVGARLANEEEVLGAKDDLNKEFSVYPNPVIGRKINFEFNMEHQGPVEVLVFDLNGKIILNFKDFLSSGYHKIQFNLNHDLKIKEGLFIYRLRTEEIKRNGKLIFK